MSSMRFHLDESVSPAIARGLRRRGVDVTTSAEAGLLGAEDVAHMTFAGREARVIVTQVPDVLRLYREYVPNSGIVFATVGGRSSLETIQFLTMLHDDLTSGDILGRIEYA